ncbi:MAG: hypothetical protein ABI359_12815 [Ginsengibacter sp.]
MRYTVLFSLFLCVIFTACTKDKFNSTPTLKFKSVSSTTLPPGQLIQFTLSFTDGPGNLSDSIFVEKIEPTCGASNFTEQYSIPTFPTTSDEKGDLVLTFGNNASTSYSNISAQCQRNDTAVFRFAIKDKENHVSDTVSSPPIIIIYQ